MTALRLRAALLLTLALVSCGGAAPISAGPSATATPTPTPSASPSAPTVAALRARATEAMTALRDKDFARLAALADPDKGVRFSPYAFVDVQANVVLPAATLAAGFNDRRQYLWGHTDGQGLPMQWTFEDYYTRHLWKKDFSKATVIAVDQRTGKGNSRDNAAQAYPAGRVVEYHLPSADPNTTLDWQSIRFVFEPRAGTWVLVGIIHDEWTI